METVTGRYLFWDTITINILELPNGDCVFTPDCSPQSWIGTKERVLDLIDKKEFLYLEDYQPVEPKKFIPTLNLFNQ